jgi:hypothetical protein
MRRRLMLVAAAAAAFVGCAVLVAGGTLVLETQDQLCAACHLPPEAAFVARAAGTEPVDLASGHALSDESVRCISCHAGVGFAHRLRGLPLAARDAQAFVWGDYTVVGMEYAPLGGQEHVAAHAICLDCHADVRDTEAFAQHFHGLLDDPDAPAIACTVCHSAHDERHAADGFLAPSATARGCDECHAAMGGPSASLAR